MAQLFANNAYGVLAGSINGAATTITLVSGHGARFPVVNGGDYFLATLVSTDTNGNENAWEIIRCTARSTDQLTVVRGQEGTTATSWNAGTRIEVRLTKEGLDNKESAITAGTISQYWRGNKTWQTLNKSAVGLGNVDNTSDANKPISIATQAALDATVKRLNVGTSPAQVPAVQHLGKLAYMDELAALRATLTQPQAIGAVWVERVSDTSIKLFMRGSDGVARSATLTLS